LNRVYITTKSISLFLATILVTGTITAFFPSSFMTEVNALSDYGMMMDDDDNYKSKYSLYEQDNINCNNFNLNANGLNVNVIPESLRGLIASQAQTEVGSTDIGTSALDNGEKRFGSYDDKKDFTYVCLNNNENEQPIPTTPTPPPSIDNNVYVVWQDDTPGNFDIFFAVSTDNGQTFSTPENLSNNAGDSNSPQIVSEGNNVYVVWTDGTTGNADTLFAASTDNGQTFSMPENLSNNAGASLDPQISSEGENVYVVWEDNTLGNIETLFAASTDNGQTFSMPENISNNAGDSTDPQISSEGENVYVVWEDNTLGNVEILFAESNDNGQTFDTLDNLSNNTGFSFDPQISSEGENVYVVWVDTTPGNNDILFAASTDNGQTFSMPENISNNAGSSEFPQISSEGNNVYVVWEDFTPGSPDIFFAESNDNGQTFSMPENLSNNAGASTFPQISTEGNNVYVVWVDITPDNLEILFAESNDNGQTFSMPENLSNNAGASVEPEISTEGNNVYVVWQDDTPGNNEILFAESNDNGQTFSTPAENISNNAGFSQDPRISITS
jgi:hypothetical protein